jgi:hypothetical protein
MRKSITSLCFVIALVLLLFSFQVYSQTPQYYNYANTGGSSNSFPFNVAGGKAVNTLFLAGEFNQPTPLPPGNQITKVYFFMSSAGTRTFTNFHILMAQSTITTLTTGTFYPGPYDTVFKNPSLTLTSTMNGWMGITLAHPYLYDPTKSLIIFVGQCGATGSGLSVRNNSNPVYRRIWSVGGCPFVPYASGDGATVNFGVDIMPAAPPTPDYLYYKFENKPLYTAVPNCASPGVGFNPAGYNEQIITSGGQFDSCLSSTGAPDGGVSTGWNFNLGQSSWTISMWLSIPTSTSGSAYYLFGDAGANSIRCFHNGAAGRDSLQLSGTGITTVRVPGIGPAPTVVTFVYDSASHSIKAFKNGSLVRTVNQSQLNIPTGTGFKVGGYSSSATFIGKMDEFRLYRKALSNAEVAYYWNKDIPCGVATGIANNTEIPETYLLNQNYPNPFNPSTKISYAIPKSGYVTLKVFNILGKEVASLINENKSAGIYIVDFDASYLSSGVYFYRLTVNDFTDMKKMILIR